MAVSWPKGGQSGSHLANLVGVYAPLFLPRPFKAETVPEGAIYHLINEGGEMRARRIEFGAGVAACALSLLAFVFVLVAPIVPLCASPAQSCHEGEPAYVSIIQASPDAGAWLFVLAMLVISLAGGMSAIAEARTGRRAAAIPLWVAAILVFAGCVFAASGAGIIYLPSVLALALAAYASILARLPARSHAAAQDNHPSA